MGDQAAPPVVVVLVAFDPGPWLEDCLLSIAGQDYPSCSLLVVDNGCTDSIAGRVAAATPSAYLHRLEENRGFGPAANVVLEDVENAAFYLLCHDDVVLAPDAVRRMVEEAFRSNAGIVCPKLLDAEEPSRLLQVGSGMDRLGSAVPRVERGELDQAQHDEVREVFAAPGGCSLVRADLFATIGGFDPEIALLGEDLDLCWRARLAGARVVVEPAAAVLHLEATASHRRSCPQAATLRRRHELRTVLKNYRLPRRAAAAARLAAATAVEVGYLLLLGHRARAGELIGCWRWNLAADRHLRASRAELARYRRVPDRAVTRLLAHRRSRLWRAMERYVPDRLRAGEPFSPAIPARLPRPAAAARPAHHHQHHAHQQHRPSWVVPVAVAVAVVLAIGSRSILAGPTPLVGQLLPIPPPGHLLAHFLGGWEDAGLQRPGPAPPSFAVLGLAGGVLLGATGLLLDVELAACVALGAIGMARMMRPLASPAVRLVATVAYLFLPLAWNDLASGAVQGLVAYAGAPFVLARLCRASRAEPFATAPSDRQPMWREVVSLGALLALLGSFEPLIVPLALACAAALALGGVVAGDPAPGARALAVAVAGSAAAFVLCLPWSVTFLQPGASWSVLAGATTGPARAPELSDLLRFAVGPMGHGMLGWALLAAGAVVLLVGRGPRLAWGTRLWMCALAAVALAWTAGRGWLGAGGGATAVLLAPAACCLAACVGLGAGAVVRDLPRARFGWRHLAGLAGGCCALAGLLPVLGAAPGGRWGLPTSGYETVLSWTSDRSPGRPALSGRLLWLGDPAALPLPGWQLSPGLALAVTRSGTPDASRLFLDADPGAAGTLLDDVATAEHGRTVRLGHLLAAAGVRAIVVPTAAPTAFASSPPSVTAPPPAGLLAALAAQTDLHELPSEGGALIFENAAFGKGPPQKAAAAAPGTPAALRGLAVGGEVALWLGTALLLASRRFRRRGQATGAPPATVGGGPGGEGSAGEGAGGDGEHDGGTPPGGSRRGAGGELAGANGAGWVASEGGR